MSVERRSFLLALSAAIAAPRVLFARAATHRRFVFILQRGAADGLHTVVPWGDPRYDEVRGPLAINVPQSSRLDGTFALHPTLKEFSALYAGKQALFVHAVASPYRDRSHFDGQNVLESGGTAPYQLKDGWLNRLLGLLPAPHRHAVALAPTIPLAFRGAERVTSYAPAAALLASEDLLGRVRQLYAEDAQLHALWAAAMDEQVMAGEGPGGPRRSTPAALGHAAATLLAQPEGARIAMIETGGWDTHAAQNGRMEVQLRGLDAMVAALRAGLGPAWSETVLLVATEFGRTVLPNGTGGTDHGTASAALVAGGAVRGGRVIADWPGLGAASLHDGRDLRPTLDLRALIAAVAADTFGVERELTQRTLFPQMGRNPLPVLVFS